MRRPTAQRIIEGPTAIYPASAVVGPVTFTEATKLRVEIGEYNANIDRRIAETDPITTRRGERLRRRSLP